MAIAIGIVAVLVLAVIAVLVIGRQRSTTGRLSRETLKRDDSAIATVAEPVGEENVEEESDEARARADDARRAIEAGQPIGTELQPTDAKTPVVYVPLDEAFLWPTLSAGFGAKIRVGAKDDVLGKIRTNREPFYVPEGRFYINSYPTDDADKAAKVYSGAVLDGMKAGVVALYQKCVHLGCRVPWCKSSQWFECPCHGSKYNRVGEKQGGPAPRGLDRFPLDVVGGNIIVHTDNVQIGPPIGTNTTGQSPEGAPCV